MLPPIGRRVEEAVGVRERFGTARVRRLGMENVVFELEKYAQAVLFALHLDGEARRCFRLSLVPIADRRVSSDHIGSVRARSSLTCSGPRGPVKDVRLCRVNPGAPEPSRARVGPQAVPTPSIRHRCLTLMV
jgi:hypothetical protein